MLRKLMAVIMLGLISSSVCGQVPNLPKAPSKEGTDQLPDQKIASGTHELTAQDLESFLEGIVLLQLERDDIAGATIAVVKDGQLLFAKGYGFASRWDRRLRRRLESLK